MNLEPRALYNQGLSNKLVAGKKGEVQKGRRVQMYTDLTEKEQMKCTAPD